MNGGMWGLRRGGQAEAGGEGVQALVLRPQGCALGQAGGGERVGIDVAEALAGQGVAGDERQDLGLGGDDGLGQVGELGQEGLALAQASEVGLGGAETGEAAGSLAAAVHGWRGAHHGAVSAFDACRRPPGTDLRARRNLPGTFFAAYRNSV